MLSIFEVHNVIILNLKQEGHLDNSKFRQVKSKILMRPMKYLFSILETE